MKWFCLWALFNFHRLTKIENPPRYLNNNGSVIVCIWNCGSYKANINNTVKIEKIIPHAKIKRNKMIYKFFFLSISSCFHVFVYCSLVSFDLENIKDITTSIHYCVFVGLFSSNVSFGTRVIALKLIRHVICCDGIIWIIKHEPLFESESLLYKKNIKTQIGRIDRAPKNKTYRVTIDSDEDR